MEGLTTVSVNITITGPTAEARLTFWPNGTSPPLVSTINFRVGQTRANNAILVLGAAGTSSYREPAPGRWISFSTSTATSSKLSLSDEVSR